MSTLILIMTLISEHGGVAMNQIEFKPTQTGPTAEELCNQAGEEWRTSARDFSTSAKFVCVKR